MMVCCTSYLLHLMCSNIGSQPGAKSEHLIKSVIDMSKNATKNAQPPEYKTNQITAINSIVLTSNQTRSRRPKPKPVLAVHTILGFDRLVTPLHLLIY